ncbi:hypothetical protein ACLBOM_05005 [Escherichia coli]
MKPDVIHVGYPESKGGLIIASGSSILLFSENNQKKLARWFTLPIKFASISLRITGDSTHNIPAI